MGRSRYTRNSRPAAAPALYNVTQEQALNDTKSGNSPQLVNLSKVEADSLNGLPEVAVVDIERDETPDASTQQTYFLAEDEWNKMALLEFFAEKYIQHDILFNTASATIFPAAYNGALKELAQQVCMPFEGFERKCRVFRVRLFDEVRGRVRECIGRGGRAADALRGAPAALAALASRLGLPLVALQLELYESEAAREWAERELTAALCEAVRELCAAAPHGPHGPHGPQPQPHAAPLEVLRAAAVALGPHAAAIPRGRLGHIWKRLCHVRREQLLKLLASDDRERGPAHRLRAAAWRLGDTLLLYAADHWLPLVTQWSLEKKLPLRALTALTLLLAAARSPPPAPPPAPRARLWGRVLAAYRRTGRVASAVTLQRRWHQLCAAARRHLLRAATCKPHPSHPPHPLLLLVAKIFPYVIVQKLPSWSSLVRSGKVVTDDDVKEFLEDTPITVDLTTLDSFTTKGDIIKYIQTLLHSQEGLIIFRERNSKDISTEPIADRIFKLENVPHAQDTCIFISNMTPKNKIASDNLPAVKALEKMDPGNAKISIVIDNDVFENPVDVTRTVVERRLYTDKDCNAEAPKEQLREEPSTCNAFDSKLLEIPVVKLSRIDHHPAWDPKLFLGVSINVRKSHLYTNDSIKSFPKKRPRKKRIYIPETSDSSDASEADPEDNYTLAVINKKVRIKQKCPCKEKNLKQELDGLSESFLNNPHNKRLLEMCKPVVVRLRESDRTPSRGRVVKKVELADIDEVHRINRSILTAQVPPIKNASVVQASINQSWPLIQRTQRVYPPLDSESEDIFKFINELSSMVDPDTLEAINKEPEAPSHPPNFKKLYNVNNTLESISQQIRQLFVKPPDIILAMTKPAITTDCSKYMQEYEQNKKVIKKQRRSVATKRRSKKVKEYKHSSDEADPDPLGEWNRQKNLNNKYFKLGNMKAHTMTNKKTTEQAKEQQTLKQTMVPRTSGPDPLEEWERQKTLNDKYFTPGSAGQTNHETNYSTTTQQQTTHQQILSQHTILQQTTQQATCNRQMSLQNSPTPPLQQKPVQQSILEDLLMRRTHPSITCPLMSIDETTQQYTPLQQHTQYQQTTLQHIPLQQTTLQHTPLQQTTLQYTPLQQTTLQHTPLQQTTLQYTPVQQTTLQHTPLQQTTLQYTPLQTITLQNTPLQQTTLQHIPLQQTTQNFTQFQQTSIQNTPLQQTTFQYTPLQQTTQQHTLLQQTIFQHTPLQQTKLQDTPLQHATFQHTQLQQTTQQQTLLQHTTLQNKPLQQTTQQHTLSQQTKQQQSPLKQTTQQQSPLKQKTLKRQQKKKPKAILKLTRNKLRSILKKPINAVTQEEKKNMLPETIEIEDDDEPPGNNTSEVKEVTPIILGACSLASTQVIDDNDASQAGGRKKVSPIPGLISLVAQFPVLTPPNPTSPSHAPAPAPPRNPPIVLNHYLDGQLAADVGQGIAQQPMSVREVDPWVEPGRKYPPSALSFHEPIPASEIKPHSRIIQLDSSKPLWTIADEFLILTDKYLHCTEPTYWTLDVPCRRIQFAHDLPDSNDCEIVESDTNPNDSLDITQDLGDSRTFNPCKGDDVTETPNDSASLIESEPKLINSVTTHEVTEVQRNSKVNESKDDGIEFEYNPNGSASLIESEPKLINSVTTHEVTEVQRNSKVNESKDDGIEFEYNPNGSASLIESEPKLINSVTTHEVTEVQRNSKVNESKDDGIEFEYNPNGSASLIESEPKLINSVTTHEVTEVQRNSKVNESKDDGIEFEYNPNGSASLIESEPKLINSVTTHEVTEVQSNSKVNESKEDGIESEYNPNIEANVANVEAPANDVTKDSSNSSEVSVANADKTDDDTKDKSTSTKDSESNANKPKSLIKVKSFARWTDPEKKQPDILVHFNKYFKKLTEEPLRYANVVSVVRSAAECRRLARARCALHVLARRRAALAPLASPAHLARRRAALAPLASPARPAARPHDRRD